MIAFLRTFEKVSVARSSTGIDRHLSTLPPSDTTAAFLRAFGDLAGCSPLEITRASLSNDSDAVSQSDALDSTLPLSLPPIPPGTSPVADPVNMVFLRAFEDVVGASPEQIPSSAVISEVSAAAAAKPASAASQLPPPEQVANELLARLNDVVNPDDES